MKDLIKRLLREKLLNEEVGAIDIILDKISRVGIKKLTTFEKDILSKGSPSDTLNMVTINWLNKNYNNLNVIKKVKQSFGRPLEVVLFIDDDGETVMEYEEKSGILYISYEDITNYVGEYFDGESFRRWFNENYNIKIRKISQFFSNVV